MGEGGVDIPPADEIRVYEPRGPARKLPIIGLSDLVEYVRTRFATSPSPVLISGETGTGKNLLAEEVHDASSRSGNLVTVLPSAHNPEMFFADLLGHSTSLKRSALQQAAEGTVFFDEVDMLTSDAQGVLAQILDRQSFRPFGSTTEIPLTARVVAATRANLPQLVEQGKFHAHLLYRLNVFNLELRPLRERKNEIPAMVQLFIERYGKLRRPVNAIDPHALQKLIAYDWPGNVRELEHTIEGMCVLAEGSCLTESELPPKILADEIDPLRVIFQMLVSDTVDEHSLARLSLAQLLHDATRRVKQACCEAALRRANGIVTHAASLLAISPNTFNRYRRGEE